MADLAANKPTWTKKTARIINSKEVKENRLRISACSFEVT
jgi:hypothetical protein